MPRQITTERTIEAKWIDKEKHWKINIQKDGQRKTFRSSTPGIKGKIEAEKTERTADKAGNLECGALAES